VPGFEIRVKRALTDELAEDESLATGELNQMSTETLVGEARPDVKPTLINDFSIQVATINGSGSQSSNSVLMRSIFQMGVPVSGKNLFPSNIQGLPTWFTIRANKKRHIARRKRSTCWWR
jgi:2-oxoglutarate ferredoxin oxidoreductase subunit alpha